MDESDDDLDDKVSGVKASVLPGASPASADPLLVRLCLTLWSDVLGLFSLLSVGSLLAST